MDKAEAIILRNEIIEICKRNGAWYHVTEENRPELGKILIEISIKVGPENNHLTWEDK